MSTREKILAGSVGSLLPLALLFFGLLSFIDARNNNMQEILILEKDIKTEKDKGFAAVKASQRWGVYNLLSLASDEAEAKKNYQAWVSNLCKKHRVKRGVAQGGGSRGAEGKVNGEIVYSIWKNSEQLTGGLENLCELIYDFETAGILHRIRTMDIQPVLGDDDANPDGPEYRMQIAIESLSLATAQPLERNLDSFRLPNDGLVAALPLIEAQPEITRDEIREKLVDLISTRSLFTDGNLPPTLTAARKTNENPIELDSDTSISFKVAARDPEGNDVALEIIRTSFENSSLSETGNFTADPVPVGERTLVVRGTDNGNPPKSVETEFVFNIVPKPNSNPDIAMDRSASIQNMRPFEIPFTLEDADAEDELEVSIVSTDGLEEVTIEPAGEENPRQYTLSIPPVRNADEYEIVLAVTDETLRKEIEAEDDERRKARIPRKHTIELTVSKGTFREEWTAFLSYKTKSEGVPQFALDFRIRGEVRKMRAGDTFEMDNETWTVKSFDFDANRVVMQVGDSEKIYELGTLLSEPLEVHTTGGDSADAGEPESDLALEGND